MPRDQPLKQHGRSDAYATIVVYDGPHACTAAVLGRILRRQDPTRPRAALIHRVSNATKAMLTADNLWELHHMRKPFPLPQSALWPRKPVIWGFQAQLWSLKQFRRVLFFDADHIPLPDLAPSRLAALWDGLGEGQLGAAPEGPSSPQGCFNSGMMLLRPHAGTLSGLKRTAERLMLNSSRAELLQLRARCPTGWNLDQPLLNAHFARGEWVGLTNWRVMTPFVAVYDACNVDSSAGLLKHADSFHYMHPARPWQQSSECALYGANCMPAALLAPRPEFQSSELRSWRIWTARASGCHVWAAVAAAWWTDFLGLPSATREACMPRISSG